MKKVLFLFSVLFFAVQIQAQDISSNPNPATETFGQTTLRDGGAVTITHSLDQSVLSGNSVSCNNAGLHADNSYFRAFDLADFGITEDFNVTMVEIGVETAAGAGGTQPITVNLWTSSQPFPNGFPGSVTLIGTADINVPDQSLTLFQIPVTGTAPAGSELVVEIFTPDGQTAGHSFFIGSNNLGETDPSYLLAAACAITVPTPTATIGFPNMHIVMNVTGETGGGGGGETFFEDFEGFTAGQQVACQDPVNWTTWSQLPCSAEDATVSTNYAFSGTNSFVIVPTNDFVKPLGDKTTGKWWMSFWMYVPTGKYGYFNTLNTFPASTTGHWGMEVYFGYAGPNGPPTPGMAHLLADNPAQTDFAFSHDTWFMVTVIVDLDIDEGQFYYGNTMIHQWQWTRGNPGTYALRLAAQDFYGPSQTADDECYFDDYFYGDQPVPVELTSFTAVANNGTVELNWETATEINNHMFEIERSAPEGEFFTIGYVEGAGTTTEPKYYSYTDANVEVGTYTYRLKQIDFDGTYSYSDAVEVDVTAPLAFNLEQNYPNPFNPSTKINYSVPEAGNVKLSVYNLVGEEVAVLVNGYTDAGHFNVSFDASNLPSGVYLYKLQSANSVQTKKMMLLK